MKHVLLLLLLSSGSTITKQDNSSEKKLFERKPLSLFLNAFRCKEEEKSIYLSRSFQPTTCEMFEWRLLIRGRINWFLFLFFSLSPWWSWSSAPSRTSTFVGRVGWKLSNPTFFPNCHLALKVKTPQKTINNLFFQVKIFKVRPIANIVWNH